MSNRLFSSSIGQKWVVAITGVILLGFATGHMIGNLQIFMPPEWINSYAKHLENMGPILWAIRLALLVAIALHIVFTIKLAIANRKARPERYEVHTKQSSTIAARTMVLSGLVVLAFIIFHLLHYTVRLQHPEWSEENFALGHGEMGRDVHTMMVQGFQNVGVSVFYIIAVFLLSTHLSHGISSFLQTVSINSKKMRPVVMTIGSVYAWFLFAGYAAVPLAILLGVVKLHH